MTIIHLEVTGLAGGRQREGKTCYHPHPNPLPSREREQM